MAMNTLISAIKAYVGRAVSKLPSHEDIEKAKNEVRSEAEAKFFKKKDAAKYATKDEVLTKEEADDAYVPFVAVANAALDLQRDETYSGDHFEHNAFDYYKVSGVAPFYKNVLYATSVWYANGRQMSSSGLEEGTSCYSAGHSIVVVKAGKCSLGGISFNAPSVGVYFRKSNDTYYQVSLSLSFAHKIIDETCIPDTVARSSDIPTDYISEIPGEYVTESELAAKGYLEAAAAQAYLKAENAASTYATKSSLKDGSVSVSFNDVKTVGGLMDKSSDGLSYALVRNNYIQFNKSDSTTSPGCHALISFKQENNVPRLSFKSTKKVGGTLYDCEMRLCDVGAPEADTDAANKAYVDTAISDALGVIENGSY